ncbi:MAG: hypothetical protein NTV99_07420 [Deltaproteobacteria bacterium]|nr:hypothetical protein [Deltaproteobacteria bacterium]
MTEKIREKGQDERLLERAREALDESVKTLDIRTLERLWDVRHRALEAADERPGLLLRLPRWVKVSGLATAAAAVLVFSLWFTSPGHDLTVKNPEDFEIVLAKDQIDLYEDLDFYSWMVDDEDNA